MCKELVGKKITSIDLADDRHAIRFSVENEEPLVYLTEADCCSHTWIEHLEGVAFLLGATVQSSESVMLREGETKDYELTQFYGERVTTDKGTFVLDYRNESNGYYGGCLVFKKPDGYYYGGVYGQSTSKENWRPVLGDE